MQAMDRSGVEANRIVVPLDPMTGTRFGPFSRPRTRRMVQGRFHAHMRLNAIEGAETM